MDYGTQNSWKAACQYNPAFKGKNIEVTDFPDIANTIARLSLEFTA